MVDLHHSGDLLPAFTGSTIAAQIWSKALRLFATASDVKVAQLKHELHSVKKGERSVAEFLANVKRLCDVLTTSGHGVTESEQIQVIFVGLTMEFESVITFVKISLVPLTMEQLIDTLLECEMRQRRFVTDMPLHANLV